MKLAEKHCIPCEGGTAPLTEDREEQLLEFLNGWDILRNNGPHKIRKEFSFKSFMAGIAFVNRIADIAEQQQHHPDILISYSRVTITLFTHAIDGLSENDFILAAQIDEVKEEV